MTFASNRKSTFAGCISFSSAGHIWKNFSTKLEILKMFQLNMYKFKKLNLTSYE